MVIRVDRGVVSYEAMTPKCGRSVVQILVVRVDISYDTPLWEISGSDPGGHSGYRGGYL